MNVDPRTREPCDCELPGYFHTGVPGILAAMEDGRVAPQAIVERCDQCCRFETDVAALARSNCFLIAEPERERWAAGEMIRVLVGV